MDMTVPPLQVPAMAPAPVLLQAPPPPIKVRQQAD
jgi:hypothetical protein